MFPDIPGVAWAAATPAGPFRWTSLPRGGVVPSAGENCAGSVTGGRSPDSTGGGFPESPVVTSGGPRGEATRGALLGKAPPEIAISSDSRLSAVAVIRDVESPAREASLLGRSPAARIEATGHRHSCCPGQASWSSVLLDGGKAVASLGGKRGPVTPAASPVPWLPF